MKSTWLRRLAGFAGLLVALAVYACWQLLPRVDSLPELSGELKAYHLVHNGRERHYQVYRPAQIAPAPALMFVFHGSMSDGDSVRQMSARQFDRVADREGFLVVYPDGYDRHWNDCRGRANYAANRDNIDDVGFVRAMLERLAADYPIDRRRVFAAGLSNGGHVALRLALEAPDLVRAVAPMAASLPAAEDFDCVKSGQPVSVAVINGTDDPINPYSGGLVKILWDDSRGVVESTDAMMDYFARLAGYTGPAVSTVFPDVAADDDSHIELLSWTGRAQEIRLYKIVGGGHTIPGRNVHHGSLLGGGSRDVDIAEELWAFFDQLP